MSILRHLILPALLSCSTAFAQMETSTMATLPEGDFFVASPTVSTGNIRWFHYNPSASGRRDIGQVFRAPASGSVNRLLLRIAALDPTASVGENTPGAAFTLRIYEYSDINQLAQAAPVSSQGGRLPEQISSGDNLVIDFDPIELKEDQLYAFVLTFETTGSGCFLNLMRAPEKDAPDGKLLIYSVDDTADHREPVYREENAGLYFHLINH